MITSIDESLLGRLDQWCSFLMERTGLEEVIGFEPTEFILDGIGECLGFSCALDSIYFSVYRVLGPQTNKAQWILMAKSWSDALLILSELGISEEELEWVNTDLKNS